MRILWYNSNCFWNPNLIHAANVFILVIVFCFLANDFVEQILWNAFWIRSYMFNIRRISLESCIKLLILILFCCSLFLSLVQICGPAFIKFLGNESSCWKLMRLPPILFSGKDICELIFLFLLKRWLIVIWHWTTSHIPLICIWVILDFIVVMVIDFNLDFLMKLIRRMVLFR